MANITLNFSNSINVSLQKNSGDIVFFQNNDGIFKLGQCVDLTDTSITVEVTASTQRPIAGDYIFFVKDAEINTSGLIGYYAAVDMEIETTENKELFAVSSEVFISS